MGSFKFVVTSPVIIECRMEHGKKSLCFREMHKIVDFWDFVSLPFS